MDLFGTWPQYIGVTALIAFILFWILWIPARPSISVRVASASGPRVTFDGE
jgi:hypothetical protein